MENIYHTIRGRTKSPRTIESNSKGPLSAAYTYVFLCMFFFLLFQKKCFFSVSHCFFDPERFLCFSWFWTLGWFLSGRCLGHVALMVDLQPHLRQLKLGKVGWHWTKPVWWFTSSWSIFFRWEYHLLPTWNQSAKFKSTFIRNKKGHQPNPTNAAWHIPCSHDDAHRHPKRVPLFFYPNISGQLSLAV